LKNLLFGAWYILAHLFVIEVTQPGDSEGISIFKSQATTCYYHYYQSNHSKEIGMQLRASPKDPTRNLPA